MTDVKRLFKYYILGESLKDIEMNRILDKVSKKKKLSDREKSFLNLYNETTDDDTKDYMLLSKNTTYSRLNDLLSKSKIVICDLIDRDGKIGLQITSVGNDFEKEECIIKLKGDYTHFLSDRFLYNIIYNVKKNQYSLQQQDEFFEKIEANND
jgi:hypothetical protein